MVEVFTNLWYADSGYLQTANELLQVYTDNLPAAYRLTTLPVFFQDSDKGDKAGVEASPGYALNAMNDLVFGSHALWETAKSMTTKHDELDDYWQGPAGDAFSKIFDATRKYVSDVASTIDPTEFTGTNLTHSMSTSGWAYATGLVKDAHKATIDVLNTQYSTDVAWINNVAKSAEYKNFTTTAAWLDDNYQRYNEIVSQYPTLVDNYNRNENNAWYYLGLANKNIRLFQYWDSVFVRDHTKWSNELNAWFMYAQQLYGNYARALGSKYLPLTVMYHPLPPSPDFPKAKQDDQKKKTQDFKPPTYNPPTFNPLTFNPPDTKGLTNPSGLNN